jgi:hypothetical protein
MRNPASISRRTTARCTRKQNHATCSTWRLRTKDLRATFSELTCCPAQLQSRSPPRHAYARRPRVAAPVARRRALDKRAISADLPRSRPGNPRRLFRFVVRSGEGFAHELHGSATCSGVRKSSSGCLVHGEWDCRGLLTCLLFGGYGSWRATRLEPACGAQRRSFDSTVHRPRKVNQASA